MIKETLFLELLEQNENLIYKVASKFYNVDPEDLYQLGVIGLLKAYKNFKDNGTTKFSTYAYDYIFGEMYQSLKLSRDFKVNKQTLKLYKAIIKTTDFLAQKLNKSPSLTDIALYMNLDEEIIEYTLMIMREVKSLDATLNENSDLYNLISSDEVDNDNKILINETIQKLDKKEQDIIKHRYFKDMTQSETAKILGMSQVAVSRAESKSLIKMRSYIVN